MILAASLINMYHHKAYSCKWVPQRNYEYSSTAPSWMSGWMLVHDRVRPSTMSILQITFKARDSIKNFKRVNRCYSLIIIL